jgi:selenocysteine lyase/cysteine desulfurase
LDRRGGTISFSFHNPSGEIIKYAQVEALANARNISLRTGCFCNPGAGEVAFGVTAGRLRQAFSSQQPKTMDQLANVLGQELGAVRISVGIASNFADAYRFIAFARTLVG